MKKILIAAIAALAVPASAVASDAAPTAKEAAKASCKTQRAQMGDKTFKATYGANAFGKCISAAAKVEKAIQAEARSDCKAEQADPNFAAAHGGKTFAQTYGTGKAGKNAYGKCVSSKAKAASKAVTKNKVNAAKTCKAQKSGDPSGFATQWGTAKNAFGKCVSTTAKAKNDEATTS
jgi:hypothetical protein